MPLRFVLQMCGFATCLAGASPLIGQTGVNLLTNPSFETGSTAGWTNVAGSPIVNAYGSPSVLPTAVATTISGGNIFLRDSSNSVIEQTVTPTIPSNASLVLEGFLGGGASDDARLIARFVGAGGVTLGTLASDYATPVHRNQESVLLYRRAVGGAPIWHGFDRCPCRVPRSGRQWPYGRRGSVVGDVGHRTDDLGARALGR